MLDGAKMTATATPAATATQVRMVVAPQQNSRFRVLSGGGKGGMGGEGGKGGEVVVVSGGW